MEQTLQEPKGVPFFSIKSGDTHYAKKEAQIQAYINSSDMGINASRGQDFGWRLGADWVKKVRKFKLEEAKMQRLTDKNGGQAPTTPQILYAIYGEQMRAYLQHAREQDAPFEEQYMQDISNRPQVAVAPVAIPEVGPEDTYQVNSPEDLKEEPEVQPDVNETTETVDKSKPKSTKPKASNKKQ